MNTPCGMTQSTQKQHSAMTSPINLQQESKKELISTKESELLLKPQELISKYHS
jgi:hypothetical protein